MPAWYGDLSLYPGRQRARPEMTVLLKYNRHIFSERLFERCSLITVIHGNYKKDESQ